MAGRPRGWIGWISRLKNWAELIKGAGTDARRSPPILKQLPLASLISGLKQAMGEARKKGRGTQHPRPFFFQPRKARS